MRRRKRSWMTVLLSLLTAFSLLSATVLADGNGDYDFTAGMTVGGTLLTKGSSAFSDDYGLEPYGDYLAGGGCGITRLDNNIAQVDGYTSCYRQCDELYLGLYMDRLEEDGSWHTIWQKEITEEDGYDLSYETSVFVKSGYYYRMRSGHIARQGNILESNTCFTNGIYFGDE